jgi:hypothetical protein
MQYNQNILEIGSLFIFRWSEYEETPALLSPSSNYETGCMYSPNRQEFFTSFQSEDRDRTYFHNNAILI